MKPGLESKTHSTWGAAVVYTQNKNFPNIERVVYT